MNIADKIPINRELAGNPVNWFIVALMVTIAGLAVSLIFGKSDFSNPGDM